MSLLVATYLGHVYPDLKISIVAFGAAHVGDATFMQSFKKDVRACEGTGRTWEGNVGHIGRLSHSMTANALPLPSQQINVRQLSYVGSGLRGNMKRDPTSYGIGDMVGQMPPDCIAVSRKFGLAHGPDESRAHVRRRWIPTSSLPNSACPLGTLQAGETPGDFHVRSKLARAPGIVVFYATGERNEGSRWPPSRGLGPAELCNQSHIYTHTHTHARARTYRHAQLGEMAVLGGLFYPHLHAHGPRPHLLAHVLLPMLPRLGMGLTV